MSTSLRTFSFRTVVSIFLVSVIMAWGLQAVAAQAAATAGSSSTGPVSNAFAMGGGLGGSIDQRTGAFQASVPLVNIAGRAGVGLSLTLSYDQSLAMEGPAGDRFGFGTGWSLGVPWVDTAGGVKVFPASGGSYTYDSSSTTGLYQYPLEDLHFAKASGLLAPRVGLAAGESYAYTLTYLNGTVDRFDANGNLIEREDRFGNRIDITWQPDGSRWQPTSVIDNYGQVTTFTYSPGSVTVASPTNAENEKATVVLGIGPKGLESVTDPMGETQISYEDVSVSKSSIPLVGKVISPMGATTLVSYTSLPEPGVVVVKDVRVVGPDGNDVVSELNFNANPPGNDDHNYTGYPNHVTTGSDGLFNSGDYGYRYSTELSDGTSTVEATYDNLHLLTDERVFITQGQASLLEQEQKYTYQCSATNPCSTASLPANYADPTSVTVTYGDSTTGGPTRSITTSSTYNDLGELTSSTDAQGTVTSTDYGAYGQVTKQVVTGQDGATSVTTNTLTPDQKAIASSTTSVGATAATATARSVATYAYNDAGELIDNSTTWAPGAKPSGPSGGPDVMDETDTISIDPTTHTRTDTITQAANSPEAASTTTISDLVTGQVLHQTDPSGLTTSYTYDALGRVTSETAPGGEKTTTVYNSPLVTTTTSPNGHITQTTTDVLGRTVKVTDNVEGEKLVDDPAARTVETDHYSVDGSTVTTTGLSGQPTTTTLDPLGRPIKTVNPSGITETTSYDDVANTQSTSVFASGAQPSDTPVSSTVQGFNAANQPTSSTTSYGDDTAKTTTTEAYDGLGRVISAESAGLEATPSYSGSGGLEDGATLTPTDTSAYPGDPVSAATENTMDGSPTQKTLSQGSQDNPGSTYTYNALGQVATAETPSGAKTSYTYTPDGQISTVTTPDATTTYTYDQSTGRLNEVDVVGQDGSTEKTGYTYDPATGLMTAVYDPADPSDRITYDYDADGHVTAVHYPDGTTTSASYTDTGELATATDITGATTAYSYNAAGKLTCATETRNDAEVAAVAYTYDDMDRVATITRGDGVCNGGSGPRTVLTYTDANQVKTETTTAQDGTEIASSTYTYDSHGNVVSRTDTTVPPADTATTHTRSGVTSDTKRKVTLDTTTTTYDYDAYDRLIASATYDGASASGTPTTKTTYTLNVAGDVVKEVTVAQGTTTTTTNTIAAGDELTSQSVDNAMGTTVHNQTYDADGNVTRDLAGNTYAYNAAGKITSVTTSSGTTITYAYWPDQSLRSATTTTDNVTHTTTFHYNASGQMVNDTYSDKTDPAVTASYLIGLNREARDLVSAGSGPAQTTGTGAGYYVVDEHGSVEVMVNASGQVTASYSYSDYGVPTVDAPQSTLGGNAEEASVNPFTYDGAYTNPDTGSQSLPARTYDPSQGRFLSLDSSAQINRYQAFNTNPINFTDPTGRSAVSDLVTDAFLTLLLAVASVVTGGAAIGAVAAAVVAGEAVTAAAVASAVLYSVAALATAGAAATEATLTADDAEGLSGNNFLSADQRQSLQIATGALGAIGAVAGLGAAGLVAGAEAGGAGGAAAAESEGGAAAGGEVQPALSTEAKDFLADSSYEDYEEPQLSSSQSTQSSEPYVESFEAVTDESSSSMPDELSPLYAYYPDPDAEDLTYVYRTAPPQDESAAMMQDWLWEYAPANPGSDADIFNENLPAGRVANEAASSLGDDGTAAASSIEEEGTSSSSEEEASNWQSVESVTGPSGLTPEGPGPGPGSSLVPATGIADPLDQTVNANLASILNSGDQLSQSVQLSSGIDRSDL